MLNTERPDSYTKLLQAYMQFLRACLETDQVEFTPAKAIFENYMRQEIDKVQTAMKELEQLNQRLEHLDKVDVSIILSPSKVDELKQRKAELEEIIKAWA